MSSYFRRVPNFDYVSRNADQREISNYTPVKNFFRRGKLREDIFGNLSYFTKYQIVGNDRPDNVALEVYGDEDLDWVVLISNNILNIQSEWPLEQNDFNTFLLDKYGDNDTIYNGVHHYESNEIRDSNNNLIFPKGVRFQNTESNDFKYYDTTTKVEVLVEFNNFASPVTNYEYEEKINDDKRGIFLLKPDYLAIVFNDLDEIMRYKKGSSQYVSGTLKRGDNIRLY